MVVSERSQQRRAFERLGITCDTLLPMALEEVSIRELRNHGGEVIDRVERGGRAIVTRSGRAVAELRPLGKAPVRAATLIDRWRRLPVVDPAALRRDVDTLIDPSL